MATVRLTLDWRVLAFSGGVAIAAALTFGLAPALRGSRVSPQDGLRQALGATSNDILFSFGRRGMALTLAGLAIGLMLAAIAARLMTTLFYGFQPNYFPAVAVVSLVLLAVAAFACFLPARRASRIDPMVALQHE
jgi:putative ABC transport system permease protein